MFAGSEHITPRTIFLLTAILTTAMSQSVSAQVSGVTDPIGDTLFHFNHGFQDFVSGQVTKTTRGDFRLVMEVASPVPAVPPLLPQGHSEIWWFWIFDLDPAKAPVGFPWQGEGAQAARPPEFMVAVRWNGTRFAGTAIDRRPLLVGRDAVVTPVPFDIRDTTVEALLPYEMIGDVPSTFRWGPFTANWSGPVGSAAFNFADYCEIGGVFGLPQDPGPTSDQRSELSDPVGDVPIGAPAFQDLIAGEIRRKAGSGDFVLILDVASPIPLFPILPPQGQSEIRWLWGFDLDPTKFPQGYPNAPGASAAPEFLAYVSWDGNVFRGFAVDRRPLLVGGAAITTPVPFSVDGTRVELVLDSSLVGAVPPSFRWYLRTIDLSGPAGSAGWRPVDGADALFQ